MTARHRSLGPALALVASTAAVVVPAAGCDCESRAGPVPAIGPEGAPAVGWFDDGATSLTRVEVQDGDDVLWAVDAPGGGVPPQVVVLGATPADFTVDVPAGAPITSALDASVVVTWNQPDLPPRHSTWPLASYRSTSLGATVDSQRCGGIDLGGLGRVLLWLGVAAILSTFFVLLGSLGIVAMVREVVRRRRS